MAILAGDALLTLAFRLVAAQRGGGGRARGGGARGRARSPMPPAPTAWSAGRWSTSSRKARRSPPRCSTTSTCARPRPSSGPRSAWARCWSARAAGSGRARSAAPAQSLGLAFQIVDDILDVEGSLDELGKSAGNDERKQKATYPALHGLADVEARGRESSSTTPKRMLEPLGPRRRSDPRPGRLRARAEGPEMSADHRRLRARDPRLARQSHRRGRGPARVRRLGPRRGAVGRLHGQARSGRAARRRRASAIAARACSRRCATSRRRSRPRSRAWRPPSRRPIDQALLELDGTPNKSALGANAILGVSLAVARAAADDAGLPLYAYLGGVGARLLPVPMMNVINGGAHADNGIDIQEFMLVPAGAESFSRRAAHGRGDLPRAQGDPEGARSSPPASATRAASRRRWPRNTAALDCLLQAIETAGYRPGDDVCARARRRGQRVRRGRRPLPAAPGERGAVRREMIGRYEALVDRYPDRVDRGRPRRGRLGGLGALTERLGGRVQLVGDDLFVTNPAIIAAGHPEGVANAVLVKVNQVGTLTETLRGHRARPSARGVRHGHLPPLGRDGRHLRRRPGRGGQRRADQDRLARAQRAHRQVQPAPAHRGGAGPRRRPGPGAASTRAAAVSPRALARHRRRAAGRRLAGFAGDQILRVTRRCGARSSRIEREITTLRAQHRAS